MVVFVSRKAGQRCHFKAGEMTALSAMVQSIKIRHDQLDFCAINL
jgi:hypothetical protein